MILRGATEAEVFEAIHTSRWEQTKRGKQETRRHFVFDQPSPVNQQFYRFKTVNPIFVEESDAIVVVTVKVYYSNLEGSL